MLENSGKDLRCIRFLRAQVSGDVKDLYDAVKMFKDLPALRSSLVNISNYDDRFRNPMAGGYRDINVLLRVVYSRNP